VVKGKRWPEVLWDKVAPIDFDYRAYQLTMRQWNTPGADYEVILFCFQIA
jgi:hypothetical protein